MMKPGWCWARIHKDTAKKDGWPGFPEGIPNLGHILLVNDKEVFVVMSENNYSTNVAVYTDADKHGWITDNYTNCSPEEAISFSMLNNIDITAICDKIREIKASD